MRRAAAAVGGLPGVARARGVPRCTPPCPQSLNPKTLERHDAAAGHAPGAPSSRGSGRASLNPKTLQTTAQQQGAHQVRRAAAAVGQRPGVAGEPGVLLGGLAVQRHAVRHAQRQQVVQRACARHAHTVSTNGEPQSIVLKTLDAALPNMSGQHHLSSHLKGTRRGHFHILTVAYAVYCFMHLVLDFGSLSTVDDRIIYLFSILPPHRGC